MRCKACDKVLNEKEMAVKDHDSGDFLDLCGACAHVSEMTKERVYTATVSDDLAFLAQIKFDAEENS